MWTVSVVVSHVLGEHGRQVPLADDQHPVGAFAADGAHPALGERVRPGRLRRGLDHVDAGGGEHGVEDRGEFRVPVAEQEPQPGSAAGRGPSAGFVPAGPPRRRSDVRSHRPGESLLFPNI